MSFRIESIGIVVGLGLVLEEREIGLSQKAWVIYQTDERRPGLASVMIKLERLVVLPSSRYRTLCIVFWSSCPSSYGGLLVLPSNLLRTRAVPSLLPIHHTRDL